MFDLVKSTPSLTERVAADCGTWPVLRSPFGVLGRAFFAQFFTSEIVTSELRLRQAMSGVLAFLLMPGMLMMSAGLKELDAVAFMARQANATGMVEPVLAFLAAALVSYSMMTISFLAVLEWDALGFDRRDAMVLGPLPVHSAVIIGAKLTALGVLLITLAGVLNFLPTVSFALSTAALFGPIAFFRYLIAYVAATIGIAVFAFAAIVTARGAVSLVLGPHLATRVGALLQFLFVGALATLLVLGVTARPGQVRLMLFEAASADWLPTGWFLGLFEFVRGGTHPDHAMRAARAALATTAALGGAILVSVAGFRRQSQLALAPVATIGQLAKCRVSRAIVRVLIPRDSGARATATFILHTLVRCRAQQELIAVNAALGAAIVLAGFVRRPPEWASLSQARTAVLWIPLVVAYTMTIGLRASFYVPSDLRCAWTFRVNGPETATSFWSATRASMIAFVVPPTVVLAAAILVPVVGWRMAAMHTLGVAAVVIVLIELVALTIPFVPFTRAYPPGHANLKTLWWVYLLGVIVFAYWPARIALRSVQNPGPLLVMTVVLVTAIAIIELFARFPLAKWRRGWHAAPEDESPVTTVLDLG